MPIYEYEGQQYDIETEDHAEAKAKILTYLGQSVPATPAAPVASAAGAPNVFAAKAPPAPPAPEAKAEPKPYTSRDEALDDAVNLLEEGVDKDEIRPAFEKMGLKWEEITAHGKKRGSDYFKPQTTTTTKPTEQIGATAEPSGRLSAAPEKGYGEQFANVFKRAKSNYEDISTAYLTQAGVINPSDAGRLISQTAKRRYNAAPTQETQDGMQEIGSAETFGDAISAMVKNPGATLSMLTDSLMLSLPAMAPAMVLGPAGAVVSGVAGGSSSFGLEYGSAMSDVLQSKGVDLLNAEAVANALSNPKIMAQIKEQGLKRGIPIGVIDGLTMGLAGRFLKPALALIAEGKLTGTAARKATIAAWSKELGMQVSGGAGGEKIAQVAAGQDKPADVVMEGLAEGVHAPFEAMSNLRGSAALERQAALGNLPTIVPGERIEPTFGNEPNAPISPTTPTEEPSASPSGVVPESTGTGVPVVSEPGTVGPAEGVARVEPNGVVPSTEDAGGAAAGKGTVPTAVAPDLASVAALPDTKTVFRTKRGSTYAFHNDGTTTRNRSGEGHTDASTGMQKPSGRTIFLTPVNVDQIGGWIQNPDIGTKLIRAVDEQGKPTSKANVVLTEDYGPKKAGTVVATVPYSKEPRVGLQPVEIWSSESPVGDDGMGMHFGSTITEVKPAAEVLKVTPKTTSAAEPVVTRNSPPEDPTQLWAPTVTLDYGNYTIENDGASAVYSFKAPTKIAPSTSIMGIAVGPDRTTLLAANKNNQEILVRIYPDHIRLDKVTGMGFKDHNFGSGAQSPDMNKIFGKKLMDRLESLPAEERVDAATRAIAEKLGVANLDRFAAEYADMQSGKPLEQLTATEEPPSGTETPEAQQAEAQGQAEPAVPPAAKEVAATSPPTLATLKPGDTVTLYRGESHENEAGGQWWTTDKNKAAQYGKVTEVTLPAEVIGQHAVQGHNGADEFVFPTEGKRPIDLSKKDKQPQEVSVNENEVRASAVPLPNGRVEPYLSRNTEPLTAAEEAAATEADEGISVFEKLRKSKLGEEQPAIADALRARDPRTALTVLRSLVDRNWSNMAYGAIEKLVSQPTFTFLADWSGIKALEDASIQLQQMNGFSQSLLADTHAIYKPLQKLLNPLFSNPKKFREKFTDLVYGSTLLRYDPADPTATPMEGRPKKALDDARKLDQMYKTLGEKGQQMYKDLRDYYEKMIKLYSDLLDAQIMQLPGMASEAKENLINVLRKTFEAYARIRPFFPLVRRGDFWMGVEEMRGANLHTQFYMFESVGDRAAARTTMLNDNPNAKISSGEGISQLRIKTYKTSEMLTKIFDAIDKENFGAEQADGTAKEALKDAIYQVYLSTMPEQSFRNQFIHRKDITGFSTDLLRNIATTASRTSMQLARLKYSPLLRNSLSAARDAVEGRPNMSPFVIEAEKRVNLALSGEGGGIGEAIAGVANKASFFWFLSGASSALIQPASVYIAGLPVLAGNHNNAKGAAYELARVSKLIGQFGIIKKNKDGTTSYTAPSIANNKSLTDLERDAVSQMEARGVSQSTYASLVYGHRDTNISSSTTVIGKLGHGGAVLGRWLTSSLMHNIERMTREGVYLAAYRLGYKGAIKEKMSSEEAHEYAINQAVKDVNEALGNYDVTNRPRWTQQGVGKMAFQFKMFPLHNTLMLLTNFTRMMPFLNEEGKKAAATKFFGTLMTVGSVAGVAGLPYFASSLAAVAFAFRSLQKRDDWPKELKDMDINTWFRNVFLPDHLGGVSIGGVPLSELVDTGPINALTQSAISERIGLSDMWGRDMKEMKTAREGISQFALEMAGPSVGLALSFADAYDAYQVGDIQKMQERLSPAALRNILAMLRIRDEGILDVAGNDVVAPEDVSTYRLINQAIGFRAATQAKASDVPSKLKGVTQQIANRRTLIQNRIKFQARKGTKEGMDKVGDIVDNEVLKFNDDFPRQKILFGEIRTMIDDDTKARLKSRVGMNPDLVKKNIELVDDALYHLENRINREEKARRAAKEAKEK